MARRRFAGPGTPVNRLEPHQAHQPPDTFPVDQLSLALQARSYLASTKERRLQVLPVDYFHDSEFLLRYPFRLVIQTGAADVQQVTLVFN